MSVTAQRIFALLLPISTYLLCFGLAAEAVAREGQAVVQLSMPSAPVGHVAVPEQHQRS